MPPEPCCPTSLNAFKMPSTVPSRPTNGAVEPVEARMFMPLVEIAAEDLGLALERAAGQLRRLGRVVPVAALFVERLDRR